MSSCRWTVMTLTCHWWSTEWDGPLLLCLLSPLRPPPPPRCQLAAGSMSSNLCLSLWRHHSHSIYGPQVGSLLWSCECVWNWRRNTDIVHVQNTIHTWEQVHVAKCNAFLSLAVFLVLCSPLEMSPSSLQFYVKPSTPQSDANTKVSFSCLLPFTYFPLYFSLHS